LWLRRSGRWPPVLDRRREAMAVGTELDVLKELRGRIDELRGYL
jgi:hypothetical protein